MKNLISYKHTKPDIKAMIAKETKPTVTEQTVTEQSVTKQSVTKKSVKPKVKKSVKPNKQVIGLNSLSTSQYMKVPINKYESIRKNTTIQPQTASDYKNLLLVDIS